MSRVNKTNYDNNFNSLSPRLLLSLTEQIKFSFLQIARCTDTSLLTGNNNLSTIKNISEYSLNLIDAYNLGVKLIMEQKQLDINTVSIASILYKTSESLKLIAYNYGVNLELDIDGKYNPILTNEVGLQTALVSLGMSLIEALPGIEEKQLTLHLASHRCRYGVVAGLYVDNKKITNEMLDHGRKLFGQAKQPLTNFSHTASAGIFIADNILNLIDLKLKTSHHRKLFGLGVILQPINQLELIK